MFIDLNHWRGHVAEARPRDQRYPGFLTGVDSGSPARIPFAIMLCIVAAFLWIFASALKETSRYSNDSASVAYFVGFMSISGAGVGIFAYSNARHNVFGMSELIGYQAPLVLALTWKRDNWLSVVRFSWMMHALVVLAIGANLSVLDRNGAVWAHEKPVCGIVQRALFAVWFFWCRYSLAASSACEARKGPQNVIRCCRGIKQATPQENKAIPRCKAALLLVV